MISENKTIPPDTKIYWLVAIFIFIKLLLLPFAQTTDPDAVSRIFFSENWKENPVWITVSDWAPFNFYLTGFSLMILDNRIITPVIVNILLSSFTLLPFYFFTKREFQEKGAFVATIFLAVSPILFRNSFLALSETPYLFFIALTLNLLSQGIRRQQTYFFILAGLSITLAAGFRYDAWLLIILFAIIIALFRQWKKSIAFVCIAMIFPIIWIIQSTIATGDPIFGISYNNFFTLKTMENNAGLTFESYLRRLWFFPFSWMIALGPAVAFVVLMEIISSVKKKEPYTYWAILFGIILILFIFFTLRGTLLMQHRFTGTLVIVSLPFIAPYFKNLSARKIRTAWIFGILTLGLSFAWNTYGVKPLPRLKDQSGGKIAELIKKEARKNSGLIIDFWNWENSYYIALHSQLPADQIVVISGNKNSGIQQERIKKIIHDYPEGIILLVRSSELFHEIEFDKNQLHFNWIEKNLSVRDLFHNDQVIILEYTKLNGTFSLQ